MSMVYALCGEGYEETIVFGVFNDEVCLRDAYYEVERYNIENITTRIYRFNLNQIEGSHDYEFNMFLERAEEVKIHDILWNTFNEGLNGVTDDFMEGIKDNMGVEVKCTEKQVRFISDLHFGHGDIIAYDNRLFRDIKHMWYSIRDAWNSVVKKDDMVYILGDVVWYKDARKAETLLNQLNGEKHLIKGNHDHGWLDERSKKCFKSINDYAEINMDDHNIVLSHYPMFSWKNMYGSSQNRTGAWIHLYGHVHMTKEFTLYIDCLEAMNGVGFKPYSAFNVGAMCPWINYVPRTLEEIERGYNRWKDSCK